MQLIMKKSDIVFQVDGDGNEIATLKWDLVFKNAGAGLKGKEFVTEGRIYDQSKVEGTRLLISKSHPEVDRLFESEGCLHFQEHSPWFMKCALCQKFSET